MWKSRASPSFVDRSREYCNPASCVKEAVLGKSLGFALEGKVRVGGTRAIVARICLSVTGID
jgi:hypothetical protein